MLIRPFAVTALALTFASTGLCQAPSSWTAPLVEPQQHYAQVNLVSNISGQAAVTDPNLANVWGLSRSSNGDWWVSDNTTGLSTLYNGTTGAITPLVVKIPSGNPNVNSTGTPTGTIFNGTSDFVLSGGKTPFFLFSTEDGTISGWNPGVSADAVIKVNESKTSVFKGMTMAQVSNGTSLVNYLYVADFKQAKISVYDTNYQHVAWIEKRFASYKLPYGLAPFNVQNLGGNLYVALAVQDAEKHDEVDGAGRGAVVVLRPDGQLIQALEYGSWFNAPWGLVIASGDFGAYSHDVLVGNFGSGTILAFDPITGKYLGLLRDAKNSPIQIDGLWGLSFGNSTVVGGPGNTLFFGAGPNGEQDGLFGSLTAIDNPAGNDL